MHQRLSNRLSSISALLGQLPDTLEDIRVAMAKRDEELALQKINEVPERHPFNIRYDRIANVDWKSCSQVLDSRLQLDLLKRGW